MSLLFLIGMPGSGKSHWAQQIAQTSDMDCIEMDMLIEHIIQMDIPTIFKRHGEAFFREAEHDVLKYIIEHTKHNTVISCGGGAPCYFDGMTLMKKAGTVVYLRAGIDMLEQRLTPEADQRPLLKGQPDIREYLDNTLKKRKSVYERAEYILDAETVSIANFAEIISACTNRH